MNDTPKYSAMAGKDEENPPEAKTEEPAAAPEAARVRELEAQIAGLKNEALRHLADAENTRKRALRDREDMARYAVSAFARDMLEVADNLERALAAAKPEMLDNPGVKNLHAGVEATARHMAAVLEKSGVRKVDPLGQKFDPNLHRVMMEMDAPDKEAGTVVQVMQPGYMIHDRLLREAMVGIAKGGSQPDGKVDRKA